MANPARELESKALKASRRERASLAQRLISSLDQEVDADADKLWLEEAERRTATTHEVGVDEVVLVHLASREWERA